MTKKQTNEKQVLPQEVIGALADAFGKSPITIVRWVRANDDRLTSEKAKKVFQRKALKHEDFIEA